MSLRLYELVCSVSLTGFMLYFIVNRVWFPQSSHKKKVTATDAKIIKDVSLPELLENTRKVWEKDLSKLPVAIDLPRLARSMTISDTRIENRNKEATQIQKYSTEERVKQVLIKLAVLIDSPSIAADIDEKFYSYIKADSSSGHSGDLSRQIQHFLESVLGNDNKVIKILKACNQSIIAPLVLQLRLNLCHQIPFKDGGGWLIDVAINSDSVRISHRKRQLQLRTDRAKEEFEFEWELSMLFPIDMSELKQVNWRISQLIIAENASEATKTQLHEALDKYHL